jgi:hypothetical protein
MVVYKCNKCKKEFNQKTNYISHINKKNLCIDININENIIIFMSSQSSHDRHVKFYLKTLELA